MTSRATPASPRTAAGRALLELADNDPLSIRLKHILAIEAEAATPAADGLDVERLAEVLGQSPIHWEVRRGDGAYVMTRMFAGAEDAAEWIADEYARLAQPDGPQEIDVSRLQKALDKVEADVGFTVYEAWPDAEELAAAYRAQQREGGAEGEGRA